MSTLKEVSTSLAGKLKLPSSITSIGHSAFAYCRSLKSIVIPDSVTAIEGMAFSECKSLTDITIPDSVTTIGSGAFNYCSSLTNFTIPKGVTLICSDAFYCCVRLTSITIPKSVTSIGTRAFSGCSSLSNITIPEGVTYIGAYAFDECSSLTSITLPEGLTSIGDHAFYECTNLTSINIPTSVTYFGDYAFEGLPSLPVFTGTYNGVDYIDGVAQTYGSSSSSGQIYEIGESYYGTSFSTSIYCDKNYEKKYNVLTFTPDKTGTYIFSVSDGQDVAIAIETELYYISLGSYEYNPYNSNTCSVDLNAGTTYYIAIAQYSSSIEGYIDLSVSLQQ